MKFIRKNGRVIPIQEKRSSGVGLVAGGAATAFAAGKARRGLGHIGHNMYKAGIRSAIHSKVAVIPRPGHQLMFKFVETPNSAAIALLKGSRSILSAAPKIGNLGRAAGIGLAALGGTKLVSRLRDEKETSPSSAAAGVTLGASAAMAAHAVGLGSKVHPLKIFAGLVQKYGRKILKK